MTTETIIHSRAVTIQIYRRSASRANPFAHVWIDSYNPNNICPVGYTVLLRKAYNPQGSFGGGFAGWKATIEIAGRKFEVLEDTQKQAVETLCRDIINSNNA
jgi:hypothetical protein